jgi:hypothetical protein
MIILDTGCPSCLVVFSCVTIIINVSVHYCYGILGLVDRILGTDGGLNDFVKQHEASCTSSPQEQKKLLMSVRTRALLSKHDVTSIQYRYMNFVSTTVKNT